jgi:hypothetical protein
VFAVIIAANFFWLADFPALAVAIGLIFFTLYEPFLVWVTRRNIERWDTAHPN